MLAEVDIAAVHWVGFVSVVLFLLALDLGVFHRKAHVISFREALGWTSFWFCLSMLFSAGLVRLRGREEAIEFLTGYVIELSLSMDNVFVIALIFAYFRVPLQYQHRVLFWGILGALIMRGLMIGLGAALIQRFHWLLYVLGVFLILTGIKMVFAGDSTPHPEKNPLVNLARKLFPVTGEFEGQRFVTRVGGRAALTPLMLVLLMVETTDLIFAVDSIPAIFAVTEDPFIVFTSNVCAILGLRSLYFVLAGAIGYFRYLKVGLSLVLTFIGIKMLIRLWHVEISTPNSLAIVAAIVLTSIVFSIVAARHERSRRPDGPGSSEPDSP